MSGTKFKNAKVNTKSPTVNPSERDSRLPHNARTPLVLNRCTPLPCTCTATSAAPDDPEVNCRRRRLVHLPRCTGNSETAELSQLPRRRRPPFGCASSVRFLGERKRKTAMIDTILTITQTVKTVRNDRIIRVLWLWSDKSVYVRVMRVRHYFRLSWSRLMDGGGWVQRPSSIRYWSTKLCSRLMNDE